MLEVTQQFIDVSVDKLRNALNLVATQSFSGRSKEVFTVFDVFLTNIGRNHSENTGILQRREICRDVVREIKKGKFVTLRIDGSLHTVVIDD